MHAELTPKQWTALNILDAGGSQDEAARAAGVQRSTVSLWANKHMPFISELRSRQAARAKLIVDRLDAAVLKAVEVLHDRLEAGDKSVALALLKSVDVSHLARRTVPPSEQEVELDLAGAVASMALREAIVDEFAIEVVRAESYGAST